MLTVFSILKRMKPLIIFDKTKKTRRNHKCQETKEQTVREKGGITLDQSKSGVNSKCYHYTLLRQHEGLIDINLKRLGKNYN